jgi:hypothetical protein
MFCQGLPDLGQDKVSQSRDEAFYQLWLSCSGRLTTLKCMHSGAVCDQAATGTWAGYVSCRVGGEQL